MGFVVDLKKGERIEDFFVSLAGFVEGLMRGEEGLWLREGMVEIGGCGLRSGLGNGRLDGGRRFVCIPWLT